jgi:ABC-type transport system involved in multi-copper enzyme maturation permease subunit
MLRNKVLYNVALLGAALVSVAYFAAEVSFIRPERIVTNFGLVGLNLGGAVLAVLLGATLLPRELERRTLHLALSRPIGRMDFVFGKFLGLQAVLAMNWGLGVVVFYGIVIKEAPDWEYVLRGAPAIGAMLLLLQGSVLSAIAAGFSLVTTAPVAIAAAFGVYLVGNSHTAIQLLIEKGKNSAAQPVLKLIRWVFPNLEHFVLGARATYDIHIPFSFVALAILYALVWVTIALTVAGIAIRNKELS